MYLSTLFCLLDKHPAGSSLWQCVHSGKDASLPLSSTRTFRQRRQHWGLDSTWPKWWCLPQLWCGAKAEVITPASPADSLVQEHCFKEVTVLSVSLAQMCPSWCLSTGSSLLADTTCVPVPPSFRCNNRTYRFHHIQDKRWGCMAMSSASLWTKHVFKWHVEQGHVVKEWPLRSLVTIPWMYFAAFWNLLKTCGNLHEFQKLCHSPHVFWSCWYREVRISQSQTLLKSRCFGQWWI